MRDMPRASTTKRPPPSDNGTVLNSLERAIAVLERLASADAPLLGITEISRDLSLPKAVVHRILSSLRSRGYVELEPTTRRYRLGPGVLRLSRAYLKRLDIREVARPLMEELSDLTGETVTLSVRTGMSRMYVDQVVPDTDIRMVVEVGRLFPLHAGGTSKALLAFLPKDEVAQVLDGQLHRLTDATITDPDRLREELETVRARGFAVSRGERQPGAASVAAPILDAEGRPIAAISVCGPMDRFRAPAQAAAAKHLLEVTQDLSGRLGYVPVAAAAAPPTSTAPVGSPATAPSR